MKGSVQFRVTGWDRLRVAWAMARGYELVVEFDALKFGDDESAYRAVMQQGAKLNGEVKAGED